MTTFSETIKFKGEWRPYQQHVLDDLQACLADKKVHIVAAPGSGKTTVGLEIIRRLDQPCLILTPSLTIREQWIGRFCSGFLPEGEEPRKWVSNTMKTPKPITVVTYQALYSAYKQLSGDLENEDDEVSGKEAADFADFNLIGTLKAAGIKTICLDEAHHLRNEWWKALEKVTEALGEDRVMVSLTATPPYDSTPSEWQRYMKMCGEIDAEIFIPELVKVNNLCPHQDYVYFNWPDEDELRQIRTFKKSAYINAFKIPEDPNFIKAIGNHPGIGQIDDYAELFLDNPKYLTALMVFLSYHDLTLPKAMRELIGTRDKLPKLSVAWMEVLLQGFLYEDIASYPDSENLREQMLFKLKKFGHIYRKKVTLSGSKTINKLLVSSKGKLNSICNIVRSEYETMDGSLRLLILTDYIKKEMLALVGHSDENVRAMGTVPIFELLRRENIKGLKLGVLSGSIVIVPRNGISTLYKLAGQRSLTIEFKPINCEDYVEARLSGSGQKQMVALMTEFFALGGVHVLIGTKSLLGEGWDSPCVNALILASFVGSYMLSNQMRGRAIRVFSDVPDKTANIWHLVSMEPALDVKDQLKEKISQVLTDDVPVHAEYPQSEDFDTLRRRFRAFLGVSYKEDTIRDGIERLSIIKPPYDERNIERINTDMLELASDRTGLRERWRKAIEQCPDAAQVIEVSRVDKALIPGRFVFFNAITSLVIFIWVGVILEITPRALAISRMNPLLILANFGIGFALVKYIIRLCNYLTPQSRLKQLGKGILKALKDTGMIESFNARVIMEKSNDFTVSCYLEGGTTYEKNIFTDCISGLLSPIDNPRYLLHQKNNWLRLKKIDYYAVPELFGSKKETAEIFAKTLNKVVGNCELVFTRNLEGRRVLLKARARSFFNRNQRLIERNHKVKSKWE